MAIGATRTSEAKPPCNEGTQEEKKPGEVREGGGRGQEWEDIIVKNVIGALLQSM